MRMFKLLGNMHMKLVPLLHCHGVESANDQFKL